MRLDLHYAFLFAIVSLINSLTASSEFGSTFFLEGSFSRLESSCGIGSALSFSSPSAEPTALRNLAQCAHARLTIGVIATEPPVSERCSCAAATPIAECGSSVYPSARACTSATVARHFALSTRWELISLRHAARSSAEGCRSPLVSKLDMSEASDAVSLPPMWKRNRSKLDEMAMSIDGVTVSLTPALE